MRTKILLVCVAGFFLVAVLANWSDLFSAQASSLKPASQWVLDAKGVKSQRLADKTGRFTAKQVGTPVLKQAGEQVFHEFHGTDGFIIRDQASGSDLGLPKKDMSIAAWVRIDQGASYGGILGCMQDNGHYEKGWLLGYDQERFSFALSSMGADDGDGKLSLIRSKTPFIKGKWYHLVASYDGKLMRLFVNGKLDAEAKDQSGPINYASASPFILGRYRDDDEDFGLVGAIKEVELYHSALSLQQAQGLFDKDSGLAALDPILLPCSFVIAPYLQYPTKNSITICAEASEPVTGVVRYGTRLPLELQAKINEPATFLEAILPNLEPNSKYFYQVECQSRAGGVMQSGVLTFQTAVNTDSPFSFCVIGDTQKNPRMTGKVMKLIWERRPHFLMHVGDVVDNGPEKREWVDELFKPSMDLLCRVPVFPTIGNHEKNHPHYYQYFSLPKPEYYYKYSYGNADFFVIDSNKPLIPGSEQYLWLDRELAASKATWKFTYHHHPAYSSDDNDYGDTWVGASNLGDRNVRFLVPLYEKHGVDICFNGHVHVYERTLPLRTGKVDRKNGVTYVTSGGGGGSLENFAPNPTWFKAEVRSDYHFCQVSIEGNRLNLKAFDHEGRLFDQMDREK